MLDGRDAEAIVPLSEAVARGDSRAGYPLGVALFNQQKLSEAVQRLDVFVRTSALPYKLVPGWLVPPRSEVVSARFLMARIFAAERQWNQVSGTGGTGPEADAVAPGGAAPSGGSADQYRLRACRGRRSRRGREIVSPRGCARSGEREGEQASCAGARRPAAGRRRRVEGRLQTPIWDDGGADFPAVRLRDAQLGQ